VPSPVQVSSQPPFSPIPASLQPPFSPINTPINTTPLVPPTFPGQVSPQQTSGSGEGFFSKLAHVVEEVAQNPVARDIAIGVVGVAGAVVAKAIFESITRPDGKRVVIGAYKEDPPDPTDVHYIKHQNVDPGSLPAMVDLRSNMSTIEDQGDIGSCTANAIAGAYEFLEKKTTGGYTDVSRLFIYYLERDMEGEVNDDGGARLRNGMKVLKQYGVCAESLWPYDTDRFRDQPPQEAFDEAQQHRIDEYHRVPVDVLAFKTCLAEGFPVVFGTDIFQSFEKDGHHGNVSMPRRGEKNLGGHAMLCVGYDESRQVFIVRNSWGTKWGDRGYCYFPYDYLCNEEYTTDCWTIRRGQNLNFSEGPASGSSQRSRGGGLASVAAAAAAAVSTGGGRRARAQAPVESDDDQQGDPSQEDTITDPSFMSGNTDDSDGTDTADDGTDDGTDADDGTDDGSDAADGSDDQDPDDDDTGTPHRRR
jgi:hypothetical protein